MKEDDKSYTVEIFTGSRWEAEVIKGLLESNNIAAMISDDFMGVISPYGSDVSVMVNEDQYEPAMEIIRYRDNDKEEEQEEN